MATASQLNQIPPRCNIIDCGVHSRKYCHALADSGKTPNGSFYVSMSIQKWNGKIDRRNARLLLYIPIQQSIGL